MSMRMHRALSGIGRLRKPPLSLRRLELLQAAAGLLCQGRERGVLVNRSVEPQLLPAERLALDESVPRRLVGPLLLHGNGAGER